MAVLDVFIRGLARALQMLTANDTNVFVVPLATAKKILEKTDASNTDWSRHALIKVSTTVVYPFCVTATSPLSLVAVIRNKENSKMESQLHTSDTNQNRVGDLQAAVRTFIEATVVETAWHYKGNQPPHIVSEFPIANLDRSKHIPAIAKLTELVFAATVDGVSAGLPNCAKQLCTPLIRPDGLNDLAIHRVAARGQTLALAVRDHHSVTDNDIASWLMWTASLVLAHNTVGRAVQGKITPKYKEGDQNFEHSGKRKIPNSGDANKRQKQDQPQTNVDGPWTRPSTTPHSSTSSSSSSSSSSDSCSSSGSSSNHHSSSGSRSNSVTTPSPPVPVSSLEAEVAELSRQLEDKRRRDLQARIDELKRQLQAPPTFEAQQPKAPQVNTGDKGELEDTTTSRPMTAAPKPREPAAACSTAPADTSDQLENNNSDSQTPTAPTANETAVPTADDTQQTQNGGSKWNTFHLGDKHTLGPTRTTSSSIVVPSTESSADPSTSTHSPQPTDPNHQDDAHVRGMASHRFGVQINVHK
jgi:uncharacterized membrane protein YgcG